MFRDTDRFSLKHYLHTRYILSHTCTHTYIYIYIEREMNNNVVITGMVMTEVTINYINKYTDVYDQHNYQNDLI